MKNLIAVFVLLGFLLLLTIAVALSDLTGHIWSYLNGMAFVCLLLGIIFRDVFNYAKVGWLDADPPNEPITYESRWRNGILPHSEFNRVAGLACYALALFALANPLNMYAVFQAPDTKALSEPWAMRIHRDPYEIMAAPKIVHTQRMCREAVAKDVTLAVYCAPAAASCDLIYSVVQQNGPLSHAILNKALDECIPEGALAPGLRRALHFRN
jgi:hypothetical protein